MFEIVFRGWNASPFFERSWKGVTAVSMIRTLTPPTRFCSLLFVAIAWAAICGGCRPKSQSSTPPTAKPPQVAAKPPAPQITHPAPETVTPRAASAASASRAEQGDSAAAEPTPAHDEAKRTWTSQRLFVLAEGGPRIVELHAAVDGVDLAAGLAATANELARGLAIDWTAPPKWSWLLEQPLVQSGWLGNLVPESDQQGQLLSLYDTDADGQVSEPEFRAFLTRGLSRADQLRVGHRRDDATEIRSSSPWGPLDEDADGQLSADERAAASRVLARFDFDGDRIVTAAEVRSTNASVGSMPMMSSTGMLEPNKLIAFDAERPKASIEALFENYTFTEAIPRETLSGWSEQRFRDLDADSDGQISKKELAALAKHAPDASLEVNFPNSLLDADQPADVRPAGDSPGDKANHRKPIAWIEGTLGGRLELPECVVIVRVNDDHAPSKRAAFLRSVQRAAVDPQLAMMFSRSFELKPNAFELLRNPPQPEPEADSDEQQPADPGTTDSENDESANRPIEPAAATAAWHWAAAPRDWHLSVTWRVPEAAWFELLDRSGDGRIVESEINQFAATCRHLDHDENGIIDANELPLLLVLTVDREDRRTSFLTAGGMPSEKRGGNTLPAPAWFSGMDYNSDGEITRAEFLGEASDFSALDLDSNGTIEASELDSRD